MSGIEFYDRVAELTPEALRRIVFVSGGALSEAEDRRLGSISNVLLQKPFGMDELQGLVDLVAHAAQRA
jgi:hypothetical protein